MDKKRKDRTVTYGWLSILSKAWMDGVLLVLGLAIIAVGFDLHFQPDWVLRDDIQTFNLGVTDYHTPPGQGTPQPLFSTEGLPSVYGIERTGADFEKAAAVSTDPKLKSLAYYNFGTLIGLETYRLKDAGSPQYDMAEGIRKLGEALRADPTNEDAKFNLELMERVAQQQGQKEGGPGEGYSPGGVQKGY
jgi:hypothetical protein